MFLIVRVSVPMPVAAAVGARFRLERAGRRDHAESEAAHHVVEHVIVRPGQPAIANFDRDVAVTEMIRGTRERARRTGRTRHRLRRGLDAHHETGPRDEVAAAQHAAAWQPEPGLAAGSQTHALARTAARREIEHEDVVDPGGGWDDFGEHRQSHGPDPIRTGSNAARAATR